MNQESAIAIDKVVGTKKAEDAQITLIAFSSGRNMLKLAFPNKLLSLLALTVLKSITNNESKKADGNPFLPDWVEAYTCERWEVHANNDGKAVLLCFRILGGAWIRLQVPLTMAKSVREALGVIDNSAAPVPPSDTRN